MHWQNVTARKSFSILEIEQLPRLIDRSYSFFFIKFFYNVKYVLRKYQQIVVVVFIYKAVASAINIFLNHIESTS
jgi:hypothetical protein